MQKQFSQQQKLTIVRKGEEIGIKRATVAEVHYTTVYTWKKQLNALGEQAFLSYEVSRPGRGIKKIAIEDEQAIQKVWNESVFQQLSGGGNSRSCQVRKQYPVMVSMLNYSGP